MCPLRLWSQRSHLFLKRENGILSPNEDQLKTALLKPEAPSETRLLISGTTHTLHRLFPINAAVLSLKVFGGLCILQEFELASITSSQLWYLSVCLKSEYIWQWGGNFFLKHWCHWEKQMKSWVIWQLLCLVLRKKLCHIFSTQQCSESQQILTACIDCQWSPTSGVLWANTFPLLLEKRMCAFFR